MTLNSLRVARRLSGSSTTGEVLRNIAHAGANLVSKYGKRKLREYVSGGYKKKRVVTTKPDRGGSTNQERGGSSAARVTVKVKHKKGVRNKKRKPVKLSKGFRDKVNKVLEKKNIYGRYEQISYSSIDLSDFNKNMRQCVYVPGKNSQSVKADGTAANFFDDDAWGAVGNVSDYVHQVSVLWNGKTENQTVREITDDQNLGKPSLTNPTAYLTPGVTTQATGLNFTVKSHSESYRLRNNSQRTVTIDIYLCRPRQSTSENPSLRSYAAAPGGAIPITAQVPYITNPLISWTQGIQDQKKAGHIVNPLNSVNDLFMKPTQVPKFNKEWNTEVTSIVLEPGQVYEYWITGPSDLSVDTGKCYTATYFNDIQKFSLLPMFVCRLDMASQTVAGDNVPTRESFNNIQAVLVERRYVVRTFLPEQTGGTIKIGALNVEYSNFNSSRRPRISYNTWGDDELINATTYNDENPAVALTS